MAWVNPRALEAALADGILGQIVEEQIMTKTLDDVLEQHVTAMAALQKIPGVIGVGFGLKEKAGQPTSEWAYRVYVKEKQPLNQLKPEERIPEEMGGIRTDVLFGMFAVRELSCTKDLAPGDQITRFLPGDPSPQGTLGILVRDGTKKFLVTNQHVLHTENTIASKDVYDPKQKKICELVCNEPAATVRFEEATHKKGNVAIGSKTFYVDVGLAEINAGIKGSNVVEGIGPLDEGTRDLSTAAVNATGLPTEVITVRKKGAATGLTVGTVTQIFRLKPDPANPTGPQIPVFEIVIKPSIGNGFDYEEEVHLASSQSMTPILNAFPAGGSVQIVKNELKSDGSRILKVKGQVFDKAGDSGSPLVDSQRKIVGLVYARATINVDVVGQTSPVELLCGDGHAVYIEASLQAIGLTPAAIIPPGIPLAGETVLAPGSPITVSLDYEGQAIRALEGMRAPLEKTLAGQRLLTLVPHMPEIISLVRHRRRVTVVWHRNKGSAFAAAFLRSLSEPSRAVPTEISEIPRSTGLIHLRDVLLEEGSHSLKEWLHNHGDFVIRLAEQCSTIADLYGALAQDGESIGGGTMA